MFIRVLILFVSACIGVNGFSLHKGDALIPQAASIYVVLLWYS